MTPSEFINKWQKSSLKESAASQSHFNDLCDLLNVEKPTDADAIGDSYCFEKGATKSTNGNGYADVWKNGCFGWEYKGPNGDLNKAYNQLLRYAGALANPPLLIVSDTKSIVIRTNWTNSVSETHSIDLEDLRNSKILAKLKNCWVDPSVWKPEKTRSSLTLEAANDFSELAQRLRSRNHSALEVAQFVNKIIFCMFAEDIKLLPGRVFEKTINSIKENPRKSQQKLSKLFQTMNLGGEFALTTIPQFNGGLFECHTALPLTSQDTKQISKLMELNWADIDPSILGTLFERGLDPLSRVQLGAHYTSREKITKIIEPIIIRPLEREWEQVRNKIVKTLVPSPKSKGSKVSTKSYSKANSLHKEFIDKIGRFTVLDPACGSGNFLYLSLKALKDIEHKANIEAEFLGLSIEFPKVGPRSVRGIEINPYAAELARVSIWIGELQWMRENGILSSEPPILEPLENIENRDALLDNSGGIAEWPNADVIVGNPPFLGNKKMIDGLSADYTRTLRHVWSHLGGGVSIMSPTGLTRHQDY